MTRSKKPAKVSTNSIFFRKVVSNGTSLQLNLTELLQDMESVKIEVISKTKHSFTINVLDLRIA